GGAGTPTGRRAPIAWEGLPGKDVNHVVSIISRFRARVKLLPGTVADLPKVNRWEIEVFAQTNVQSRMCRRKKAPGSTRRWGPNVGRCLAQARGFPDPGTADGDCQSEQTSLVS